MKTRPQVRADLLDGVRLAQGRVLRAMTWRETAVRLAFENGATWTEIADRLGMTETAVREQYEARCEAAAGERARRERERRTALYPLSAEVDEVPL